MADKRDDKSTPPTTPSKMRPALDADDVENPEKEEGQLDIALDETYPASDAPAETQPHSDEEDKKPAPSTSGGD
ncbi:hypothetical protein B5C34_12785 [Pacificimonas flava]|uniref:Uncharacterized protein n=2 Tax=Pacificimonas TaxID=1960290 RepID=A0A219B7B0_9SPHN|nr:MULTISPECIES: hypothetical protein [Pacificimonas]MBZ6378458.1 hypothetical protein [Pacificimonas aurantium]OWV34247.1 hypothetical protein B5C34_12785 [Pacificimonas flava]